MEKSGFSPAAYRKTGSRIAFLLVVLFTLVCIPVISHAWQGSPCSVAWKAFRTADASTSRGAGKEGAGGAFLLALTLVPPEGAYMYGPDVQDGLPTTALVSYAPVTPFAAVPSPATPAFQTLLREKGKELTARLPAAMSKKDTPFAAMDLAGSSGDTPIYAGPVTIWVEIPSFQPFFNAVAVRANFAGLLCSATSCTPFKTSQDLIFDAAAIASYGAASEQSWWNDWQQGAAVQLSEAERGEIVARDTGRETVTTGHGGAFLSAVETEPTESFPVSPQPLRTEADKALERYSTIFASLAPIFPNTALEVTDLGGAIFFGILAGLLLNLMPCVLPVVSLKFSALMAVTAMTDKREQARAFRSHCLIFAAGVMTWFLILALLLGTAGLAWGEMFQSPPVIVGLALVLYLLGLSLFGVFALPILNLKFSSTKHPHWQAFSSGLLATLLATPCSGPLLGGVLGWALRQPLPVLALAIISVGVGMSLPYWILAMYPRLVHLLPRPGAWTIRLEQLLGFFLMGSVVYLVTLLPTQWIPPFLFNLLAITMAAWLWGQIGHLGASTMRRIISRSVAVSLVLFAVWWGAASLKQDFTWEKFDPEIFTRDLGKEPMLLEFTADWCPSCKALEYTTLNKNRMALLRREYKMRTIQVDLTRDDPAAKELLKALNSSSIPVIALFPEGDRSREPLVLRDIVTPGQLQEALGKVF